MPLRRNLIALLAMPLYAACACAAEPDERAFELDGFGTLGIVHSDYTHADFVTYSYFHPKGVGYSRSWSADQDTRLGLQLSATFAGKFSAVVQAVSQQRYDNTFRPSLEWANIKYAITPELSIRAGRVLLPTFLTSDTANVNYVNEWVRTPAEVLIQLPVTTSDGVDVTYHFNVGPASNRLQLLYGGNESQAPNDTVYKNTGIRAIIDTIEYGPLTVHVGYQRMHYSFAANGATEVPKAAFEAVELGVLYDPGRWYLTAEQFNARDQFMGNTQAWYVGAGYRFGSVTAYLVSAQIRQTSIGDMALAPVFDQKTSSAGLRWDFLKNFAAKLQYDRIVVGSAIIPTSFVRLQPGLRIGDRAGVLSATLDFVW